MDASTQSPTRSLEVRKTYTADRQKVFAAWTQPDLLRQWWGVADEYTTPLVEVDLQVGWRYRLGMLPPNKDDLTILAGEYLVIEPPERLVFTGGMENDGVVEHLSTITLQFLAHGKQTHLILTHEYEGTPEMAKNFRAGWEGMLGRLDQTIGEG